MSNQWFRMYAEFAHDPKVQMMSEAYQRRFVMILCMMCGNVSETLHDEYVAFQLRITDEEWAETKRVFVEKNLIANDNKPVAWNKRQYVSDSSTARVKEYREKVKRFSNVTVTPPDTDTDTEKDIVEKKPRQRDSIPYQTIISFLNEKAGKDFQYKTQSTKTCIRARWKDGFRLSDFQLVTEHKCNEWINDPKMNEYLRPQTLFGSKFESYLQSAKQNFNDGYR